MKKIILFLLCLTAFAVATEAQIFKKKVKKAVPSVVGSIKFHPDSITIKSLDNSLDFTFLDRESSSLFVTSNKDFYDSASVFLPFRIIKGRSVEFSGTAINPFSQYSKKDLDELSKKLGTSLNGFKVVRIFGIALVGGESESPKTILVENKSPVKEKEDSPKPKAKKDWGS